MLPLAFPSAIDGGESIPGEKGHFFLAFGGAVDGCLERCFGLWNWLGLPWGKRGGSVV
ncbi:hypothetical protein [Aureimonas sp. SA4125]|uniref:hypothetical protein n=1 Tax=Aureimonas sp. SA4125 TaxID=2826993 RepID=UPI001CC3D7CF|nr:hypothetical protein [Aureimonas sp. SA4125]